MFRSHVMVCGGTGCTSSGSDKIAKAFEDEILATGLENEVKVIRTGCFGLCALGPIVVIYPEGSFYSMVKEEDVKEIVDEHLLKGRPVTRLLYDETVAEDNTVKSLDDTAFYKKQMRIALRNCGVIDPEDIKMEAFRSSGAGGQHINKTSSAVRLIHIPTGIVVSCQNERSQFQNRDMCMKMLAAKLYQIKEREHLDKISDIKGVQNAIAWGSQIRSYVFMPYTLVKDHRTGFENGNVNGVMDGDLDGFINAYLKMSSKGEL